MSEQAPERSGGGFSFSKKYGPLPAYGWILLAAGAGIAYVWWRNRQSGTPASQSTTGTSGVDYAPEISTIQSEVQNLQSGEAQNAVGDQNVEQQLDTLQAQETKERPKRPRKPPAKRGPANPPGPPRNLPRPGRPVPKGGPPKKPRIAEGRTHR